MIQELLGASPALSAVREELSRLLARTVSTRLPPVLIQGETGTGKGLVAHLIHQRGPRAGASFVDVNCAAIPETLLEAEIFGFERGAFTDARQAKPGLLQVAHRGTIFLDEIGLMPDSLQVKLLKALEDRSVRRLGSTRVEPADAWVLAATSEDLATAMRARRFREDLYHRLAVVTVQLPPLRERGTDVLLLARHYLNKACADYGLPGKALSSDADTALLAYTWPGNVRELANVMERVALLSDHEEVPAAALRLPTAPRTPSTTRTAEGVNDQIATLERARIEEALRADAWNISRAAVRLGLPRNTLRYRMQRHGLSEGGDAGAARRSASSSQPSSPVRWQRLRLTLLQAQILDLDVADHDRLRVLEQAAAKASTFGGRILELGSSSVKAAFGLDLVEDAACHAAHAAFAVQRAVAAALPSHALPVRIALHTDEMLVGRMDDRVELDADARRSAEGLMDGLLAETAAEPLVASEAARPFIERRFHVEPLVPAPLHRRAWRVLGLVDAHRYATPFVSRARELALLEDLLSQVEDGRGQGVLLAGDAGIGKTRLLHEFRLRTRGRAAWFQGASVSFGSAIPFHPLIDLLKHAFSVQPGDSDEAIGDRIDRATAALGEAFRPSARFLRSLLSIGPGDGAQVQLDPKLLRAGIFEAIGRFLHASSQAQPVIAVLEDLHWMDQATGEFLATMAESLVSGRILLCATHRTGYTVPLAPGVFGTHLTLARVSRSESGVIGSSLLGAVDLSADLQQLVDDKTDGNPFFIEEIVRSLDERGLLERSGREIGLVRPIARVDVPDSVQDVLLGRLDRLDATSRNVLRIAAVIGREFPRRVLERLVSDAAALEESLRILRSAELIHNTRVWPEVVYAFKHALTHEVAYDAQAEAERHVEHGRIGEAMEQVYADRLSEHFGVLAHHFTHARRWDRALDYLLAAAQQAERTFATRDALALCDEALRAAEHRSGGVGDPETLIRIYEAKARLYFVTSQFDLSAAEGERILPLARLIGNRATEAEALATIAWASTWGRNIETAIRAAKDALAVAVPAGALAVQGRAQLTLGFVRGVTGALEESVPALEKAMTISAASGDVVTRSLSLSIAGLVHNWSGDYDEASRLTAEALLLARERGLLLPLLFSCFMRGLTLTGKGEYDEAFALFTEGLSFAERIGDEAIHHRLLNCLGWLYADLGDLDHAERLNATSAQIGRRRRDVGTLANAELNLAEIFAARGDVARAQDLYDGVFKYWKDPSTSEWMKYRYSIRMFIGMGELAVARNDLATARRHSAESLELATRTRSRKNLVKAWRLAGDLARVERDWDKAERHLRTARDLAASLGNPVQQWKVEHAFGQLCADVGRADEAAQAFQRALQVMLRVRESLRGEPLVRAFDKNPDVRLVHDLVAKI